MVLISLFAQVYLLYVYSSILINASSKIVKFQYGLHTNFSHLDSVSTFGFLIFVFILFPLISLDISTCFSDSIFALTFITSGANW